MSENIAETKVRITSIRLASNPFTSQFVQPDSSKPAIMRPESDPDYLVISFHEYGNLNGRNNYVNGQMHILTADVDRLNLKVGDAVMLWLSKV